MKQRVLVASNRGPVSYQFGADGSLAGQRGGGGMIAGVTEGLAALGPEADVTWICAALSDADRVAAALQHAAAREGVHEEDGIEVRMLDIPPDIFDRAYNNVANSALWFVHHLLFDTPNQPQFGHEFRRDWESYLTYNEAFADALAQGAREALSPRGPGPPEAGSTEAGRDWPPSGGLRILVQDYHLCLAPRMLRDRLGEAARDAGIAHFSHTPWAPPDYYRLLPEQVGRALLDGILGADHAGFHTERWAAAFVQCCAAMLGAEVAPAGATWRVTYRGHVTEVAVHPLGVDAPALRERARAGDVQAHVSTLRAAAADRKLIVRVDRTELSKNIVRGLAAYRELLATRPQWRGRVVHLAFAYPSRSALAEYRAYTDRVRRLAREITEEFGTAGLGPADPRGEGRLPAVAGRLRGRRRPAGEPGQGRHEPGRAGGPGAVRARLRAGALPRGRRRRDAGRRRAARQPLRHHRDGRGPASGARHARRRTPAPQRRAGRRRRRGAARALAGRPARRAGI